MKVIDTFILTRVDIKRDSIDKNIKDLTRNDFMINQDIVNMSANILFIDDDNRIKFIKQRKEVILMY